MVKLQHGPSGSRGSMCFFLLFKVRGGKRLKTKGFVGDLYKLDIVLGHSTTLKGIINPTVQDKIMAEHHEGESEMLKFYP